MSVEGPWRVSPQRAWRRRLSWAIVLYNAPWGLSISHAQTDCFLPILGKHLFDKSSNVNSSWRYPHKDQTLHLTRIEHNTLYCEHCVVLPLLIIAPKFHPGASMETTGNIGTTDYFSTAPSLSLSTIVRASPKSLLLNHWWHCIIVIIPLANLEVVENRTWLI